MYICTYILKYMYKNACMYTIKSKYIYTYIVYLPLFIKYRVYSAYCNALHHNFFGYLSMLRFVLRNSPLND